MAVGVLVGVEVGVGVGVAVGVGVGVAVIVGVGDTCGRSAIATAAYCELTGLVPASAATLPALVMVLSERYRPS